MALREFTDSAGTQWRAWDVPPHRVFDAPRTGVERRVTVTPGWTPERRQERNRRRRVMPQEMIAGWVCFDCGSEKRRLVPPPPEWQTCSDQELEEMCARAQAARFG